MPPSTLVRMSGWSEHAIWWQAFPLGFLGAERALPAADMPPVHRLPALLGWLDYLVELGCNGLALGPVFTAGTHGYDTIDPYRIDPRLGDGDDFAALVDGCRSRGVRLLLDGVFDHVGRDFPAFADVRVNGRRSAYADWFRIDWGGDGPDGFSYATFEGHGELVALNHDSPAVVEWAVGVLRHWLDAGADGWRLDAAYAVPAAFWRSVLPAVRSTHPEAWLLGEVIHGDYPAFVAGSGVDSVTQYELWKAIWSSLSDRNLFELAWALKRHAGLLGAFRPLTFVGNHDVTRIASRLPDVRHLPHALAVLFTVGGIPSVYYGDEQAFRGVKEERAGGDDAVRPAFPARPAELAPYGWPTYRLHQELIGVRRRHPWLTGAASEVVHLANEVLGMVAAGPDGARVATALNLGDGAADVPLGSGGWSVAAGAAAVRGESVRLDPHGWAVLTG